MKRITIHDKNSLKDSEIRAPGGLVSVEQADVYKAINVTTSNKPTPYLIEEGTLNGHVPKPTQRKDSPSIVNLSILPNNYSKPRRFMHTKASIKSYNLDSQIDRFAERAAIALGLSGINEFGHPGLVSNGRVTVVGRIILEQTESNEKGFLLETSRQIGSGCRTKLELDGSLACGFFPGQMVVLEGHNYDGNVFHVICQKHPSLFESLPEKTKLNTMGLDGNYTDPFTMIVANGPFTLEDQNRLDFTNFEKLLNFAYDNKPSVLILMGPFIDCENSLIRTGKNLTLTPEELFQRDIIGRINILAEKVPSMKIILVSSIKDLICDNIFPQPIIEAGDPNHTSRNIAFISNPSFIQVNELIIGICNVDILLSLGTVEFSKITKGSNSSDHIRRLCDYIHQQANFYPLHPAPPSVNIDYDYLNELEFTNNPDMFITSSQLRYFGKEVSNCTFINAGQFCKRQSTGTAALISVHEKDKRVDFYQF